MFIKNQNKSVTGNTFSLDKLRTSKFPDLTKSHRFNGITQTLQPNNSMNDTLKNTDKNEITNSWIISKNTVNKAKTYENEEIYLTNYSQPKGKKLFFNDQTNKDNHKQNRIPETNHTKDSFNSKTFKRKLKNEVISIEDIDDDRPNNNFNKLSVNPSDYILPHKMIQSVQLNKGNLKENIPKKIIAGYQINMTEKLYLVEWENTDISIILPSFIKSEFLKENYSELVMEYLETIIVQNNN